MEWPCTICSSEIYGDGQYYEFDNMGPEIITLIENNHGCQVTENCIFCENCFTNVIQVLPTIVPSCTSQVSIEYEGPHPCDTNVCVWCHCCLYRKRVHSLPEGPERQLIFQRINPRDIPDGSLVCHACWSKVRRILRECLNQESVEPTREINNSNVCVWCHCSLNSIRRHAIPEGPERDEIIRQIHPREIPPGGLVCYACWISAKRNVLKAQNIENEDQVSLHKDNTCVLCGTSMFRRLTHRITSGRMRDDVAAKIHPRELPNNAQICRNCWTQKEENMLILPESEQPPIFQSMQLDEFAHTPNSSRHCFVPECTNTKRLRVPDYLRTRILKSRNIFVTDQARVCNEHRTAYNWDFLDRNNFSSAFTKPQMEAMLRLCVQEDNRQFDFEKMRLIDDGVFTFWTGLTKNAYMNIYNRIRPALKCKNPHTALSVYFIKSRTGASHERIACLVGVRTSDISCLLDTAEEALLLRGRDNFGYPLKGFR